MLECNTLLCVRNQLPSFGADDIFIVGYLVLGFSLLIYLVVEALREY